MIVRRHSVIEMQGARCSQRDCKACFGHGQRARSPGPLTWTECAPMSSGIAELALLTDSV